MINSEEQRAWPAHRGFSPTVQRYDILKTHWPTLTNFDQHWPTSREFFRVSSLSKALHRPALIVQCYFLLLMNGCSIRGVWSLQTGWMEPPNGVNGGSKRPFWRLQTPRMEALNTRKFTWCSSMLVNVGQCWSMLVNGFSECRTFAPSEKIPGERAKCAALS